VELFLNILWLLLLGPGIGLWLRRRRTTSSLRFFVALACLLFLLFPVISASDDLHAMRSEMEESSPGKRVLEQIAKRPGAQLSSTPPAQLTAATEVQLYPENSAPQDVFLATACLSGHSPVCTTRPPPSSVSA
jgi:HAMP domain-containing protein